MKARTKSLVVVVALASIAGPWNVLSAASEPHTGSAGVVATEGGFVVEMSEVPVLYQGKYYSDAEISVLNTAAKAMFADVRVTPSGEAVARAFDTYDALLAAEDASGESVPDVSYPAVESASQRLSRLDGSDQLTGLVSPELGSDIVAAAISGCPNITYGSRDYDNSNCGGSYLAFSPNDAVSNFGTYGHNDKMSSLDIQYGGCIVTATLYNNASYSTSGGVWRYFGVSGGYASYNLPSSQNDRVSSEKSVC